MKPLLKLSIMLIFYVTAIQASEALMVIYDSGDTQPIAPYLPKRVESITTDNKQRQIQNSPAYSLPITTPSMQSGAVTASAKALRYLQQPLFLVGSDLRSQAWLIDKRKQLIRLGAVGLLIQARDHKDVETMLQLAEGLRLVPASAEGFAYEVGLTHYPILLSNQGWEQ